MPRPGFLNTNRNRAYPFLLGTTASWNAVAGSVEGLPNSTIVDAGLVAGLDSGFIDGSHKIWLDRIRRSGNTFYFDFTSNAPGLFGQYLTYTRNITDELYTVEYNELIEPGAFSDVSESISADTVLACVQLGTSGTFVAPYNGKMRFYFNDDFFFNNAGEYVLTFNGIVYHIPGTQAAGVDGPDVVMGQSYVYLAGGIVNSTGSNPETQSTPDGPVLPTILDPDFPTANFICPNLQKWSLVAKILETIPDPVPTRCGGEPLLYGFVQTGDLTELAGILASGSSLTKAANGCILEPALIQNVADAYVSAINLGNADRTRVSTSPGCNPVVYPYPTGEGTTHVNARCITGEIRFEAGFNAVIRQESGTNTIIFSGTIGAGKGEPCEEVPLFSLELPPAGSQLLEGGPRCNEVIRSINGVGGQITALLSGQGVLVIPIPAQHTIIVDVNMSNSALCYSEDAYSLISEPL